MFTKEWNVEYKGNKISVFNTLLRLSLDFPFIKIGDGKLYINGEKQDECNDVFVLGNKPIMQGKIDLENNISKIVKIYMKSGLFSLKTKVCIDDEIIGGDNF